jgi:hypothetical protein
MKTAMIVLWIAPYVRIQQGATQGRRHQAGEAGGAALVAVEGVVERDGVVGAVEGVVERDGVAEEDGVTGVTAVLENSTTAAATASGPKGVLLGWQLPRSAQRL